MSAITTQNRADLCTFTFADGRQCRTPHSPTHLHLCAFHARKEAQAHAAANLGRDVSYFFSGEYVSACDLSVALGRLFPAVVEGHIKPKTATTLAYLAQTLLQTIQLAQHELTSSCGTKYWQATVREHLNQNADYLQEPTPTAPKQIQPPPAAPAPPDQPEQSSDETSNPTTQSAELDEPSSPNSQTI